MRLVHTAVIATLITACSSSSAPSPSAQGSTPAAEPAAASPAVRPAEPAGTGEHDVTLTTLDGVTLGATYIAGPAGGAQAVVLLHQLSSTRAEWAPFVDALRGKYHLLALDMRGHGASAGATSWKSFKDSDWEAVTGDLAAATQFLSAKGVPLGGTVVIGSSIGSTATLRFAGEHPDLAGIVLVSPGLKYRGVETVPAARKYGRPKLVVFSTDSEDAALALEQVWKKEAALPQPQPVTMRRVPGKAHGVKMLADDPGLVDAVVDFVERTLAP
jgi:pimeloyl-ACP methyl ester carboxylesterase